MRCSQCCSLSICLCWMRLLKLKNHAHGSVTDPPCRHCDSIFFWWIQMSQYRRDAKVNFSLCQEYEFAILETPSIWRMKSANAISLCVIRQHLRYVLDLLCRVFTFFVSCARKLWLVFCYKKVCSVAIHALSECSVFQLHTFVAHGLWGTCKEWTNYYYFFI
jgi:hypothetical protein